MQKVYTVKEVAEILRVQPNSIYRWVRRGTIRAVKIQYTVRIPESELRRLSGSKESDE